MAAKDFKLTINNTTVLHIEVSGSDDIVDHFVNKTMCDSFGILADLRKPIVKAAEAEIERSQQITVTQEAKK